MKKTIQTGLRVPEKLYNDLKANQERIGLSVNQQILFLVDVGRTAIRLGSLESARTDAHSQQEKAE